MNIDIKDWIKRKLGITALEDENVLLKSRLQRQQWELQNHKKFVTAKVNELKKYTRVDADVGFRGNNTIVLTGVYRNKGFVRFYDIGDGQFERLVKELQYMKDHCLIRNIDAPPTFRGSFKL